MSLPTKPVVRTAQERHSRGERVSGVTREEAFSQDGAWVGTMATPAGEMSGWHHHGDHDTYAYVLSGTKLVEYADGGSRTLAAGPGDFVHLPPRLVHRDGAESQDVEMVVFRVGTGPTLVEAEEPRS